ncbi:MULTISPECIES: LCP family protein [Cyanophyceae]|uniref:LCP family protein n=1 Tax=Cyanophyceae TaxID=3028117 RepID=UPI00232F414D|nr:MULTISPECIES: LCP family protein [Cyanophyceae]MDB9357193.1 LCP family protein [Nodularia spumigena CS-587/03]MDB9340650.1 LCP family protein [Nodularia spumigena CS-589/07]MDB9401867.1 LCP family protein [Microcystis aeruginosa CS-567/02-A1]MDB9498992.1 LCP family protein [Nodularia spumigena CS-336/02]MDB9532244.1 LCP family protein [Nodularia spumigena CS-1038]
MIKQFQWSENQVPSQEVPELELEEKPQQIPWAENELGIQQPSSSMEIVPHEPGTISRSVVESVGAIPNELYDRLGLTMPRWLLWILTVVLSIVFSGLLVSTVALWTPLWSNLERTDEELGFSGKDEQKVPLPGELWGNISQYKLSRPMNILIMGVDPIQGTVDGSPESFAGTSDTMLLVRLNPSNKTMRVLSIPRDTMIAIPEKGLTKVSDANAQGGPVLAARVVSRTLNNAPIHRYIRISTSGLRQLVDQLGGVDVFVPQEMQSQDTSRQLSINLVSGWQTLDGEQAEKFARFREPGLGDLPRVQRQQSLMKALLQRLNSPTVLPRLPQLTRLMRKYFDTNLKIEEMMALVNYSVNLERDNFQMTILPGTFSRFSQDPNSYWLNLNGQQSLLNNYVGVDVPGLKADLRPVHNLKIAIQNASNQPQLTEKVIHYLKQKGFKNVYAVSAWPDTQRDTQILVQKGDRATGLELHKFIGLGKIDVSATGDLESDLTIRIGQDWK